MLRLSHKGPQRLRQRGGFAEPTDCRKALAEWLAHANPLAGFIEERGRPDLTARMPPSAFYRAFRQWADEAGIRNIPARNTIKRNLENLGYRVDHGNAGSTVFGIDIEPWYAARDAA